MATGCVKNPKTALFGVIKYNGPHDYKYWVSYWEFEEFQLVATCRACGSSYHDFGITFDELVSRGFDPEFVNSIKYDRAGNSQEDWRAQKAVEAKEGQ